MNSVLNKALGISSSWNASCQHFLFYAWCCKGWERSCTVPHCPLHSLLTQFAVLLAFPSVSSVLMENLLFPGLLTSTLLRSMSCKDHLIVSWVVEVMEAPCMQYSSSCSLLPLSNSDFLPTGICSGSRQLPPLTTAPGLTAPRRRIC